MLRDIAEDSAELVALWRMKYITSEIGEKALREFLTRHGYNATDCDIFVKEATPARNTSALEWLTQVRLAT